MLLMFDPSLFSVERATNPAGLAEAIRHLQLLSEDPSTNKEQVMREVLSIPHLLGFIISVQRGSAVLVEWILRTFPTEPGLLLDSCTSALLLELSRILLSIHPQYMSSEDSRSVSESRQYVEHALPALATLCSAGFVSHPIGDQSQEVPVDEDIPFMRKVVKQRRKVKTGAPTIDTRPFHKLGICLPSTNREALLMANEIMRKLKQALQDYLAILSNPELAPLLRNTYVTPSNSIDREDSQNVCKNATVYAPDAPPSVCSVVQPMKAALYFENADNFGEWRILIGSGATKKLREFRKSDAKKFKIVVKKITQLSNGHFSKDNQKRLDETSSGVPIYEAKMQRDLRLVYQVDCIPDHDGVIERQVIKIYGIYTHTQLNRIWDAISRHLAGKGTEYLQRCTYRNKPIHVGDNVYLPATFPPELQEATVKSVPMVLSNQDMDQLHSLLVLEKYVTFSQSFYNGLIANEDVQHVFELTPQERKIVECLTSCYVLGRSGTGKTTTMLFRMLGIERAWQMRLEKAGMTKPRQIFVTKSRVLAMKVEEYFIKLLKSLSLAGYSLEELANLKARNTHRGLVDIDDVPDSESDIPARYSQLEDHHFPLFVTFDRLAKMIALDILDGKNSDLGFARQLFDVDVLDSLVTYEVFRSLYWPHFPQNLTKGLDPWLVFSEIMGIIKGSERSLGFPDRVLCKKTYCDLPPRSYPTFANHRDIVYGIFEAYCKLKRQHQHHDIADRSHTILKILLSGEPLKGPQIDFLYVDEAQDNLLIDALLLRLICRNPEGLFWAGDTAQTISAGSSFRFDDLKAFLHRIEADQASNIIQKRAVSQPKYFQLTVNYRSHGGIVNCAHSLIELISRFWPNAIDCLQPEHGIVDGLKPVFFSGWDQDTVRYEQFLFGASGSHIEFGAQQCILVRDEEAREKLRQQVGEIGLIMTLYESKGLEFNDVLLYNFFEDSIVDVSRWRLVLAAIQDGMTGANMRQMQVPCFERDEGRYAGVCSELKLLYVGITRARKNMWIVDKSERGEPMRLFWTARSLVQTCTPETEVPHLAVSSTAEEWAESGRALFDLKRYTQAMHCFGRANMQRQARIAEAYYFRQLARGTKNVALLNDQKKAFIKAADAFVECGNEEPGKERLQYYRTAAECYIEATKNHDAARAYLSAEEYELAAKQYRKVGAFSKTVEVLKAHSEKMSPASANDLMTVCRLFYCSRNDESPPSRLFSSFEEESEFLETYGLDVALVALLESHGKYLEAAELYLSENNNAVDAIRVLLLDKRSKQAMVRAGEILLECLWYHCPFGVTSKDLVHDQKLIRLLSFAEELPLDSLSDSVRDQITMFKLVNMTGTNCGQLKQLATSFLQRGEDVPAVWCMDHVFTLTQLSTLLPVSATLAETTTFLREFYDYVHLLYTMASHPDPVGKSDIRKLFAIAELSKDTFALQPSFFVAFRTTNTGPVHDVALPPQTYSREEVTTRLKGGIRSYLRWKVNAETRHSYDIKVFSQCLVYIIYGSCKYAACKQEHIEVSSLDSEQYNMRIGIHLQQIRILQLVYSAFPEMRGWKSVKEEIIDWVQYLYEAISPPLHVQGSIAELEWRKIPEASECIRVMKNWVRGTIYTFLPWDGVDFLSNIVRLAKLSAAFDERDAPQYITRAMFMIVHQPRELFRSPGCYIVEDLIECIMSDSGLGITKGVLGVHHIIHKDLAVNLSVLCDCIEEIFSMIVLTLLIGNDKIHGLHDAVLPRSWLVRSNKFTANRSVQLTSVFLDDMLYLLNRMRSDNVQEVFSLLHTKVTRIHLNMFISRICRTLCIFAHNCPSLWIGFKVKMILSEMKSIDPDRRTPSIYRRYAEAEHYLRVLVADEAHAIKDLVHLIHARPKDRTTHLPYQVKKLTYRSNDEIPGKLAPQLVSACSSLCPEAKEFVPRAVYLPRAPKAIDTPTQDTTVGHAEDSTDSWAEDATDDRADDGTDGFAEDADHPYLGVEDNVEALHKHALEGDINEIGQTMHVVDVPEEVSAACRIQIAYRRHLRVLRYRSNMSTLEAEIQAIFKACLKQVRSYSWEFGPYRTFFLGPLPHLLLALEKGIASAEATKAKTKLPRLLLTEGHENLEELGRQRSELSSLLKQGHNLRKTLYPESTFHKNRNSDALKSMVQRAREFVQGIPGEKNTMMNQLNIAYKAIVTEKKIRKEIKPSLNVEDLDPL